MIANLILASGGIESTVLLAEKQQEECHLLYIDYGMDWCKLESEIVLEQYEEFCAESCHVLKINQDLYKRQFEDSSKDYKDYKKLYMPGRNLLFLSYAVCYALTALKDKEVDIFIGAAIGDNPNPYVDLSGDFFYAYQNLLIYNYEGLNLKVPFLYKYKMAVIKLGIELEVDFTKTFSCYRPIGILPCGKCNSCLKRLEAFEPFGGDPATYA